ncbi:iron ABC transporter ATP-binding protein [Selenomonas sp. oral taxon 920]|uniref:ABC transporter ATP-binding protein n=1 Tax=Selenomonas sp. oral taxon 920 TaxID=1884263 RepID=UPI000840F659|nr:ABC transporter ATP-binding protein [Selenomonas sp. oral taxon 920]AOH48826.1 iron ABC transporter ATP-binding protein [Selenomonas sp. oral taxon 920]
MSAGLMARDLSVKIAGKEILHGLSVDIAAGRRTAIVGPNGAGKTTLLRALAGLNRRYTGEIQLDGRELGSYTEKELARVRAILPQERTAAQGLTVEQLVTYGRFAHANLFQTRSDPEDREAIAWAMETAHVSAFAEREVHTLSGGERQRVFLAMALSQRPRLLLLDEPTTYLDVAHQLRVMEIISQLNRIHGMTILMVLHDMAHAMQYADEIVLMQRGRVVHAGTPADVLTEERIADVFGVRVEIFTNSRGIRVPSPVALVGERSASK